MNALLFPACSGEARERRLHRSKGFELIVRLCKASQDADFLNGFDAIAKRFQSQRGDAWILEDTRCLWRACLYSHLDALCYLIRIG